MPSRSAVAITRNGASRAPIRRPFSRHGPDTSLPRQTLTSAVGCVHNHHTTLHRQSSATGNTSRGGHVWRRQFGPAHDLPGDERTEGTSRAPAHASRARLVPSPIREATVTDPIAPQRPAIVADDTVWIYPETHALEGFPSGFALFIS